MPPRWGKTGPVGAVAANLWTTGTDVDGIGREPAARRVLVGGAGYAARPPRPAPLTPTAGPGSAAVLEAARVGVAADRAAPLHAGRFGGLLHRSGVVGEAAGVGH